MGVAYECVLSSSSSGVHAVAESRVAKVEQSVYDAEVGSGLLQYFGNVVSLAMLLVLNPCLANDFWSCRCIRQLAMPYAGSYMNLSVMHTGC
ncbi:hypothetical protein VNO80_09016 [Phaseolus coccineus]|uniref:Uncharacterized protein n=1 Tax=Phaseolus coccineus TaxID=3886 RepID=A0AAN9RC36_PHACN